MQLSTFIQHSTFKISVVSLASFGSLAITTTSAQAMQIDFSNWQEFGDIAGNRELLTGNRLRSLLVSVFDD